MNRRFTPFFSMLFLLSAFSSTHGQVVKERYYAIYVEGKRIGYSHDRIEQTPEGRKVVGDALIKLSLLGTASEQSIQSITLYSPDGKRPLRYTMTIRLNTNKPTTIDCRFEGGKVVATATLPGQDAKKTLPWTSDSYLIGGDTDQDVARLIAALGPAAKSRTVKYLDPLSLTIKTAPFVRGKAEIVSVGGRKRPCDTYTLDSGISALHLVYARDTGQLVEMRRPAAKVVSRLADRTAMKGLESYEFAARAFALTDVRFADPGALTRLKLRVKAFIAGEKLTVASLQSPTQKFTGTVKDGLVEGIFEIRPFKYDGKNAPAFTSKPVSDSKLATYLKPEGNVECNDPEIVALAQKLTEESKTQWEAVQRIGKWVNENIGYAITGAGAKQCLTDKKGDCGPHTWLTIALCRAAGIPARITGGALWSDALGGSFGQHYWTRVWMGPDGWVPIDTTTGEVGTLSPTHLTFWNLGGIGSLSVKVLDYAPKEAAAVTAPSKALSLSSIGARAGEKETYSLQIDGKKIGEQTAECTKTDTRNGVNVSDWNYSAHITIAGQGATVKAEMTGVFTITDTAMPVSLSLSATANGSTQKIKYAFEPKKVKATINLGGTDFPREIARSGSEFMMLNEIVTHLSLITRAVRPAPGQKVTIPIFVANTLNKMDATLTAQTKTETIKVGGRDRECVVCDIAPFGFRLWLARDSGALMRATADAAKMVIERQ